MCGISVRAAPRGRRAIRRYDKPVSPAGQTSPRSSRTERLVRCRNAEAAFKIRGVPVWQCRPFEVGVVTVQSVTSKHQDLVARLLRCHNRERPRCQPHAFQPQLRPRICTQVSRSPNAGRTEVAAAIHTINQQLSSPPSLTPRVPRQAHTPQTHLTRPASPSQLPASCGPAGWCRTVPPGALRSHRSGVGVPPPVYRRRPGARR